MRPQDNAVLVCHALTGSALVGSWWPEIFAPGAVLSLEQDFVICINMLGSCYGSTGPGSVDPETGKAYGPSFPLVSIRDNVRAQAKLLDSLGIRRLRLVLGGSIGGMQALDWAMHDPRRVERAVIIGVAPLAGDGPGAQSLAASGDPARPGVGGRQLSAAASRRATGWPLPARSPCSATNPPSCLTSALAASRTATAKTPGRRAIKQGCLGLIGGRFDIAGYLDHQGERFIEPL